MATTTTRQKQPNNAKRWCFTWHKPETMTPDGAWAHLMEKLAGCNKIDWAYFGRETTQTGGWHAQGFLYTSRRMRLTELKKVIQEAHFEVSKGTDKQNWEYCTKQDKEPKLVGPVPSMDELKMTQAERQKQRWKDQIDIAKSNAVWDDMDPGMFVRYHTTWKRIRAENKPRPEPLEQKSNFWMWGPPGGGKTQLAKKESNKVGRVYYKTTDQWWENYDDEEVVIIEDLDPYCVENAKDLRKMIKNWADLDSFEARIKGSSLGHIRPKRIVVTSNFSIEDVFRDAKDIDAFKRRFKQRYIKDFKEYTCENGMMIKDFYKEDLVKPDFAPLPEDELPTDDEEEINVVASPSIEASATPDTIKLYEDEEDDDIDDIIDLSQTDGDDDDDDEDVLGSQAVNGLFE